MRLLDGSVYGLWNLDDHLGLLASCFFLIYFFYLLKVKLENKARDHRDLIHTGKHFFTWKNSLLLCLHFLTKNEEMDAYNSYLTEFRSLWDTQNESLNSKKWEWNVNHFWHGTTGAKWNARMLPAIPFLINL